MRGLFVRASAAAIEPGEPIVVLPGSFALLSSEVLSRLEAGHQIAARYADEAGEPTEEWPANPNGSPGGVAGVCDPTGRLFGLMPHPDAYLYPFQHPQWFRQAPAERASEGGGLAIFRNGVDAAAAALL